MWLIPKIPTMIWLIPKIPTTIWLILKFHYDVANSKAHYDVALFTKPATTQHYLQKSLWCDTIYKVRCYRHLKVCCYTAILYKISKSFLQSPNSYLASSFTKPKFLFGIYFHKAQILIWHYFTKSKYYFGNYPYTIFIKVQMLIQHQLLQSPNTNLAPIFTKSKY